MYVLLRRPTYAYSYRYVYFMYICVLIMIVGFIDFIVDPCFQVMGDMLEAVLRPLQENKDETQPAPSNTNHSSRSSSLSSRSSGRSTPSAIRTRERNLYITSHCVLGLNPQTPYTGLRPWTQFLRLFFTMLGTGKGKPRSLVIALQLTGV